MQNPLHFYTDIKIKKLMSTVNKIITRIYRIGTGDCIALQFMAGQEVTFKMLIDCGACQGDKKRFKSFAEEIENFMGGHLDLLVVTHEHFDHIIGFARAHDVFKNFTIDNVWLAWTEDPDNKVAKELSDKWGEEIKALRMATKAIRKDVDKLSSKSRSFGAKNYFLNSLTGLTELYFSSSEIFSASGNQTEMEKAMSWVKGLRNIHYCYPGKLGPKLKGTEGIRFYFLGPPEDAKAIMTDEIKDDLYEHNNKTHRVSNFVEALDNLGTNRESISPFDNEFIIKDAKEIRKFKAKNLGKQNELQSIENDWLYSAGELGLRLEKSINNTSLAMAIEFIESGKVLLFPGDAQSGNWKSWHDTKKVKWKVDVDGKKQTVFAKDLLERTVLYKVGHHCSHNGTASQSGLELMTSDELVALIPLDTNIIKSGWLSTMPTKALYKRLAEKTKGRMFRLDEGLDQTMGKNYRKKLTSQEAKDFNKSYKIEDKYIEYEVNV
ncbi:MAG: hypothetical protein RLZZ546_228 [Bacteroidota bacterium]